MIPFGILAYLSVQECEDKAIQNKTRPVQNNNILPINSCTPCFASSALFLLVSVIITSLFVHFVLIQTQKVITPNINENNKTSKYKKPSKLFF